MIEEKQGFSFNGYFAILVLAVLTYAGLWMVSDVALPFNGVDLIKVFLFLIYSVTVGRAFLWCSLIKPKY